LNADNSADAHLVGYLLFIVKWTQ